MNRKKSAVKMSLDSSWHTPGLVEIAMDLTSSNCGYFIKNASSKMKGEF